MLAIDGGSPVRTVAWPAWPQFESDERGAVAEVLESGRVNYWTGTRGRAFERAFADYTGVAHGIAVANGTVAIEVALQALGIGEGDEVIVPSCTFVATASAVMRMGARPVFADLCPRSGNLTPQSVDAVATERTRAVIAVHLGGWPARVVELAELCRNGGYAFIEDCAQAHGAAVGGQRVGSFSDVAAFSFCQDKIMTTAGEGGMVVAREEALARRIWSAKDHGKSWEAVYEREHPPGFRWLHETLGTNGRMTELQAAVGLCQLGKLDTWVARRRGHAGFLRRALSRHPAFDTPELPQDVYGAYYRLYTRVRPEALATGWDRDRLMVALEAEGLPCRVGSCTEIFREKVFDALPRPELPVAAQLARVALSFTTHPTLDEPALADAECILDKVMAVAAR
ncbi:MAG: DegT/DnrJ/EryC1/StrS family aminotransferase [Nannocystaceae bacterium]|nr:DegT/DnrJ/EryC1/StrS family aminotransferase [Nannocystaceae bacterium]